MGSVSIHAPTRGATQSFSGQASEDLFQSTHPHGVRLVGPRLLWPYLQFQSTHPHGVRLSPSLVRIDVKKFQSTHPHGVRQNNMFLVTTAIHCFNPRTHTGCDYFIVNSLSRGSMFQSTHPHGVRRRGYLLQ